MNFVCPKCDLGGSVDDAILPQGGAWATCPSCKERFHIKNELPLEFTFSFDENESPLLKSPNDVNKPTECPANQEKANEVSFSTPMPAQHADAPRNIISMKVGCILVAALVLSCLYSSGVFDFGESNKSNRNSTNQNYDVRQEINKRELRIRAIDGEIAGKMLLTRPSTNSDPNLNPYQADSNSSVRAIYEGEIFKLKSEREMIMEQLKLLYQQQTTGK